MKLTEGSDARVVDVKVDNKAGEGKADCRIQGVQQGRVTPGGSEGLLIAFFFLRSPLLLANCLLCSAGSGELNGIRQEEVARYEGEQDRSKDDILLSVVVTLDADKDPVL